jgi:ABC-type uncharacterized transport system auxiliary subunit
VQRGGADHFVYLEFERWGEQPANAVTDAVREALAGTGSFTAVSAAGDALVADRYLDGYVLAFDLVETPSGPWKARVALRLVLSDRAGKLLHTSVYDASRPLPGRDPAGLGPAMAASVGEAVTKALADWEAAGLMR